MTLRQSKATRVSRRPWRQGFTFSLFEYRHAAVPIYETVPLLATQNCNVWRKMTVFKQINLNPAKRVCPTKRLGLPQQTHLHDVPTLNIAATHLPRQQGRCLD